MSTNEVVKPQEIVKANNELFRCKYKIKDVVAGRIFMAFASLVDHKDVKENQSFVEYQISASSIMQGIDAGGDYYDQIRAAAYSLVGHKIEQRFGKNNFSLYTLFSKIEYRDGIIKGEFHKDLVPFFIIAREKFTKLKLTEYMQLPSIYSQAIFGFLKSWSDRVEIVVNIKELHEMLDTPQSLRKDFYNFKARVLDKAHKDINEKTSLAYDFEPIKNGRSFSEIKFKFIRKEKSVNINMNDTEKTSEHTLEYESQKNTIQRKLNLFCEKFKDGKANHIKCGRKWYALNEQGIAPLANDVPENNEQGVLEFLEQWEASHSKDKS